VFKHLPVSQVTAILKQLSPALAMAVLAALPQARAQAVLEGLSPEETVALQGAPAYPTYTAGGLMTSVCLRVSQDATAAEAIALLRSYSGTPGQRAYLYCVAGGLTTFSEAHLVGVVSLWEVLAVDPTCRLRGFMRKDVVSVTPWTDLRTVANVLEAHELLALPVVDEQGRFLGSVTLEALLPYLVPARRTWQWPITQKHARAVPQR
jgi:Mg/Co/Ni transporter MgtE